MTAFLLPLLPSKQLHPSIPHSWTEYNNIHDGDFRQFCPFEVEQEYCVDVCIQYRATHERRKPEQKLGPVCMLRKEVQPSIGRGLTEQLCLG